MTSCGVNIPLSDIANAIVNDYGNSIAELVIRSINLGDFVQSNGGTANNLSLVGGVKLDDVTKADLCLALEHCLSKKAETITDGKIKVLVDSLNDKIKSVFTDLIKDTTGTDNYVTSFNIDDVNNLLTITMKGGELFSVSKDELENWLSLKSGGIKSGSLDTNNVLTITNNDGTNVSIDLSKLKFEDTNTFVDSAVLTENNPSNLGKPSLVLHRSDDIELLIDLSELDISKLKTSNFTAPNSPYIVSGVFLSDNGNYRIEFTRSDNSKITVAMGDVVRAIASSIRQEVMSLGHRINTQVEDYTLQAADFDGRTIVRAEKNGNQTITIGIPSDDFIGKSVIIRKTNGDVGTFVTLKADGATTLSPDDVSPLRRIGSSATLTYIGNGVWDVYGELP